MRHTAKELDSVLDFIKIETGKKYILRKGLNGYDFTEQIENGTGERDIITCLPCGEMYRYLCGFYYGICTANKIISENAKKGF